MNKNIRYEVKNKKIILGFGNEKEVTFNFPIRQVFAFDNCLVVRIEPEIGKIYNENVFGISPEGKILWQIAPIPHVYNDSPYTGMGKEENFIKVSNWDGTDLIINPNTGEIISQGYSK